MSKGILSNILFFRSKRLFNKIIAKSFQIELKINK